MSSPPATTTTSSKRHRAAPQPRRKNKAPRSQPLPLSSKLPADIIEEIISLLPVESLLRFLCVSTHWHSLISSPHFILRHLRRASSNPRLLGGSAHYPYNLYPNPISLSRPLQSLIDNPTFDPPLFLQPPLKFGPLPQIIGSVNGMICFARYKSDNYFHYYNPATRGSATSPAIRHAMVIDFDVMHGFGYDPRSDTYKTVVIECDSSGYYEDDAVVKVYTLGAPRSWKRIKAFPFIPMNHDTRTAGFFGRYVDGSVNWLAERADEKLTIVSVDLREEICREISPPDANYKDGFVDCQNLWALGGSLCFSYDSDYLKFVVWEMKTFGVAESWTQLFNIVYTDIGIDIATQFSPRTLFMVDKGVFLLDTDRDSVFILYDVQQNSYKEIKFGIGGVFFCSNTYTESLVCPTNYLRFQGSRAAAATFQIGARRTLAKR